MEFLSVDDIKINSRLTLGEDAADLGGTILAWEAWMGATAGKTLEAQDGLTPERGSVPVQAGGAARAGEGLPDLAAGHPSAYQER